jgi:hypothetical protein
MADEYIPRELGLLCGHLWASKEATLETAKAVADSGEVPDAVVDQVLKAGFADRLEEFPEPADAPAEFWQGFVHGVRALTVEGRLADLAKLN